MRLKLDDSIDDIGLYVRALNALKTDGITTVRQLVNLRYSDILKIPNMGRVSANQTQEILQSLGLNLRKEHHPDLKYAPETIRNLLDAQEEAIEAQEAEIKRLRGSIEFVKRWVQRVHDKETTLEEFYGIIRYDEVFKPVEAALAEKGVE